MRYAEIHTGVDYAVDTTGRRWGSIRRARVVRACEVERATTYTTSSGFEVELLTEEGESIARGDEPRMLRRLHSRAFKRTWAEEVERREEMARVTALHEAQREARNAERAQRGRPIIEALRERLGADWGTVDDANEGGPIDTRQVTTALEGTRATYLELSYADLERLLEISPKEVVSEG